MPNPNVKGSCWLLSLFLCVLTGVGGTSSAIGQALVSGNYEGLRLAVDTKGNVVGTFKETAGLDQRATCEFQIAGRTIGDRIEGEMWAQSQVPVKVKVTSKANEVQLSLVNAESFVCPPEQEKLGPIWSLARVEDEAWIDLRAIDSDKAYFYTEPQSSTKRKAYVIKHDWIGVLAKENGWLKVEYIGGKSRTTGWMRIEDTRAIEPGN